VVKPMLQSTDRRTRDGTVCSIERLPLAASQFVQYKARELWLVAVNYGALRRNIEASKRAGELELVALQSRFSLQIGVRIAFVQCGLHMEGVGGPFEAAKTLFGESSEVYIELLRLDRRNPVSESEILSYASECETFVASICDLVLLSTFDLTQETSIDEMLAYMRALTRLAQHLNVAITWPQEDVLTLEEIRSRLKSCLAD